MPIHAIRSTPTLPAILGTISVLSLLVLTGCNDQAKLQVSAATDDTEETAEAESSQPTKQAVSPNSKASSDESTTAPRETISRLEDAGAEIKKHSSGQVSEVHIRSAAVTDAMAEELCELSKLVKLTINESEMSDAGWSKLSSLGELQHFDLRGCKVNNTQLANAVKGMPKLKALRLNGKSGATTVDDGGLEALSHCTELKALALDHLWIGEDGLKHLQGSKKLTELYLAGTLVEDSAMKLIAGFPNLRKLRVAQTSVSGDGLAEIQTLKLEDLDLSECSQLFDDAMEQLAPIKSLKRLNLFKVVVSDLGVEKLEGLANLQWLNLDQTQLTDTGLPFLSGMTEMSFMHLGSTGVSDAGMTHLTSLKKLKDLKLTRTAVTEQGAKTITDAIPGCEVQLKYEGT